MFLMELYPTPFLLWFQRTWTLKLGRSLRMEPGKRYCVTVPGGAAGDGSIAAEAGRGGESRRQGGF